jgi:hypothetical protein
MIKSKGEKVPQLPPYENFLFFSTFEFFPVKYLTIFAFSGLVNRNASHVSKPHTRYGYCATSRG